MRQVIRTWIIVAAVVGTPVLVVLIVIGVERTVATLTCELAQVSCNRSILHGMEYIIETIETVDKGQDVTIGRKRK